MKLGYQDPSPFTMSLLIPTNNRHCRQGPRPADCANGATVAGRGPPLCWVVGGAELGPSHHFEVGHSVLSPGELQML